MGSAETLLLELQIIVRWVVSKVRSDIGGEVESDNNGYIGL